ncbi:MAG: hypothetical protein J3R72DRAFT_241204 [Linnemannia gamsii]|nr:MAG: hypothetical protein J3R72DRAFT_241204 [Linnemannia gamsii]
MTTINIITSATKDATLLLIFILITIQRRVPEVIQRNLCTIVHKLVLLVLFTVRESFQVIEFGLIGPVVPFELVVLRSYATIVIIIINVFNNVLFSLLVVVVVVVALDVIVVSSLAEIVFTDLT